MLNHSVTRFFFFTHVCYPALLLPRVIACDAIGGWVLVFDGPSGWRWGLSWKCYGFHVNSGEFTLPWFVCTEKRLDPVPSAAGTI